MDRDFTRTCPPWKSSTKTSGVPVCSLIIAEHLEEILNRHNIAESHPLSHFRYCTYFLMFIGPRIMIYFYNKSAGNYSFVSLTPRTSHVITTGI
jgi:hypothetical protein